MFLGGRYSLADVIEYGGIPEAAALVRSSDCVRGQPNADTTAMERAQQLALARDVDFGSGNSRAHHFSIASIPNEVVIDRADKLGVSLGLSPTEISTSISHIKDVDLQRTLTILQKLDDVENHHLSTDSSLVLHKATYLSTDLVEEEHKGSLGDADFLPKLSTHKKGFHTKVEEVKVVRRSARLNKNKRNSK